MAVRQRPQVFDFDSWASLARNDPAGFELQRRNIIDAIIERALPRQRRRLRGLQFRIDMERRRARSPMAACVRIQSLMWDSLAGPDGLYERVLLLRSDSAPHSYCRQESLRRCATILPFPTNSSER